MDWSHLWSEVSDIVFSLAGLAFLAMLGYLRKEIAAALGKIPYAPARKVGTDLLAAAYGIARDEWSKLVADEQPAVQAALADGSISKDERNRLVGLLKMRAQDTALKLGQAGLTELQGLTSSIIGHAAETVVADHVNAAKQSTAAAKVAALANPTSPSASSTAAAPPSA